MTRHSPFRCFKTSPEINPDTYLRDETGNRRFWPLLAASGRFWPLRCGTIDIAALARDRDQLWAEAVHRFREGAIWWIDDAALLAEARTEQESRYQGDAWDARIDRWLTHDIVENAAWYCWHALRRQAMLEACWEKAGAFVHQQIIWVKDRGVLTRSHYLWKHEPCFMG